MYAYTRTLRYIAIPIHFVIYEYIGYAKTTLSAKKEQNDIPVVVMHEEDIRWNHLYLSATRKTQYNSRNYFLKWPRFICRI